MSVSLGFDQKVESSTLSHINTQVVYPISINQDTCTIIIPNRAGSLDKHTAILLPATVANASSFYPIGTGVAALIDSCTLLANGKVIAQNSEVGQYITMSNMFQQQEYRRRVLLPRTGVREDYGASECGTMNLGATNGLSGVGKIGLKNTRYHHAVPQTCTSNAAVDSFGDPAAAGQGNNNYRLATTSAQTAQFYLYLEQIFAKLYSSLQLPIHLIDSEVSLVIRFSSNNSTFEANDRVLGRSSRVIAGAAVNPRPVEVNCQILTEEVCLLTDYLVPTSEANDKLAQEVMSPEGLQLNYGDMLFNNFYMQGLPDTPGERNFTRYNFSLGMAGKTVRQMYLAYTPTQNTRPDGKDCPYAGGAGGGETSYGLYNAINPLKGKYCSKAISYLPDGERLQINFNSQNVFNTPISGAQCIHELQTAYGSSFCVPASTQSFMDMVLDDIDALRANYTGNVGRLLYQKSLMSQTASAQGWTCQNLVGANAYRGINFQRPILTPDNRLVRANIVGSGQTCGNVPIEIQIDRLCNRGEDNDDRNMLVCCIVEKQLVIRQGQVFLEEN